jgi:ABC-type uncharacterized transport system ATPase component
MQKTVIKIKRRNWLDILAESGNGGKSRKMQTGGHSMKKKTRIFLGADTVNKTNAVKKSKTMVRVLDTMDGRCHGRCHGVDLRTRSGAIKISSHLPSQ